MSQQGERLIKALQSNPDLLFEVLDTLHGEKVAGPWTVSPNDHTKFTRTLPGGKTVAIVKKHPTRRINPWEASTSKPRGVEERPAKNHPMQGVALDWADARLMEQGYQLAKGE